uniref:CCT domain-containing protein n=1 Tax=Leersia perrieri TaxID=77586 RepID=A0A0D9VKM4_9ORYZ
MSCSSADKAAGAVGGKAARACDSCLRRRARWYCAADDAFLCQGCDTSVHSANPLARRHERLRLRASSPPRLTSSSVEESKRTGVTPAWSKRKARTRRPQVKSVGQLLSRRLVVPEMAEESSPSDERNKAEEDGAHDEEEGQLLYRVPVFDPALTEFRSPPPIDDATAAASSSCLFKEDADGGAGEDTKYPAPSSPVQQLPDSFINFEPTDAELREFAADMEALLGQGLDDSNELQDSFYMETLGLMSTPVDEEGGGRVKMELDGVDSTSRVSLPPSCRPQPNKPEEGESADVLDIDFNCNSPTVADDDEQKSSASNVAATDANFFQKSLDLRLNYEEIIESWGSSPWTDGQRPHGQIDDLWPNDHNYGLWSAAEGGHGAEAGMMATRPRMDGPGREARVTRYREKRRTRLFSKKIRYEVRKLNAEKRPRMKGRFVKRPSAAPCAVT